MITDRVYSFVGGSTGAWQVVRMDTIAGAPLAPVARVEVINGDMDVPPGAGMWRLRGVTSNQRYTTRAEHERLVAAQPVLGRTEATCAALIPIRKTNAWWALPQDKRRTIFEERSAHIQTGLAYLPAIARRLHHCRDLGEPFDFLTWFEYAAAHADAFEQLLQVMRATEEWAYVEREVDIRLIRVG